jgi:hypothetical protein
MKQFDMCIFSILFLCVFMYCNALWQELVYAVLGPDVRHFFLLLSWKRKHCCVLQSTSETTLSCR